MAKKRIKGTPEYEEWLRKYREKRGKKANAEEAKPSQPLLFKEEEVYNIPENVYPHGTKKQVYSKSQKKNIEVEVIRFVPKTGKYLVSRKDGKFLYYSHDQLQDVQQQAQQKGTVASGVQTTYTNGKKNSVSVVPPGSLSEKIEKNVAPVTADIIYEGMSVDVDEVDRLTKQFEASSAEKQAKIDEINGAPLNINKPADVAALVYDKLGLPQIAGRSTAAEVLDELYMKTGNETLKLISGLRSDNKMLKSYLYKFKRLSQVGDGKIYNLFAPAAVSGRFTAKLNPFAVEVPDDFEVEKKVYFPADLEAVGMLSVCPAK